MFYFKNEKATIVSIQKNLLLHNSRQLYITVKVKRDNRLFSFYWSHSPTVILDFKVYGNKVPLFFEHFWELDNLEGTDVILRHTADDTYAYLTPVV